MGLLRWATPLGLALARLNVKTFLAFGGQGLCLGACVTNNQDRVTIVNVEVPKYDMLNGPYMCHGQSPRVVGHACGILTDCSNFLDRCVGTCGHHSPLGGMTKPGPATVGFMAAALPLF